MDAPTWYLCSTMTGEEIGSYKGFRCSAEVYFGERINPSTELVRDDELAAYQSRYGISQHYREYANCVIFNRDKTFSKD